MKCENCGMAIDKYFFGGIQQWCIGDGIMTLCRYCSPTFSVIIREQ